MKKLSLLVSVVVMILLGAGCQKETAPAKIADYFVAEPNTIYEYDGDDQYFSAWNIYFEFIDQERGLYQRKIEANNKAIGELIKLENGQLKSVYGVGEYSYLYDYRDETPNTDILILQEPLHVGQKWVNEATPQGDIYSEITSMNEKITVPHGTYKAMAVKTTFLDSNAYRIDYYVKGMGFVKSATHLPDGKVVLTELKGIIKDKVLVGQILFFYPDANSETIQYEQREVQLPTGTDIIALFQEGLHSYADGHNPILPESANLNSISLDHQNQCIVVDLSKEFVEAMNKEPGLEVLTLQALGDTMGYFFNYDKTTITIDGKPYQSDNVFMQENSYILRTEMKK